MPKNASKVIHCKKYKNFGLKLHRLVFETGYIRFRKHTNQEARKLVESIITNRGEHIYQG